MTAVPVENVSVGLMAVTGKAGWNAIFGNTQSTVGTGENVINGFRRFAAINTTLAGKCMKGLSPSSDTQFGAEFVEKNRVPAMHPNASVEVILP